MNEEAFLEELRDQAHDLPRVLELTLRHFRADTGTIHELGNGDLLHLKAWSGSIPEHLLTVIQTIPVGKGMAGLAVERKEPVNLCNLQSDASGAARPQARDTGVKGSLCVPVMSGERAVGALGIATIEEREFSERDVTLLMEVGRMLAACG